MMLHIPIPEIALEITVIMIRRLYSPHRQSAAFVTVSRISPLIQVLNRNGIVGM
jgi:hypothetical protein